MNMMTKYKQSADRAVEWLVRQLKSDGGKLYQATGNGLYLETAKGYLDFALSCDNNIRTFYFSHKVAWGAAIMAQLTGENKYVELSKDIADYLLSIQEHDGGWLTDQPAHTSFDQTAEIGIWLREMTASLLYE